MKGQITVEFITITGIVSIIFLVAFNFMMEERKLVSQSIWAVDAQDTAEELAASINHVYLAGDGASLNVTAPKSLVGGVNYTITVYQRLVSINVPAYGREFEWKFITGDVEGAGSGLSVKPGGIRLKNVNGTIHITGG
jgi:hypothetical protein